MEIYVIIVKQLCSNVSAVSQVGYKEIKDAQNFINTRYSSFGKITKVTEMCYLSEEYEYLIKPIKIF